MFLASLQQPLFGHKKPFLTWYIDEQPSVGDWAYPWEVLGTVYPTKFVWEMLAYFQFASPSQLEAGGALHWQDVTDRRMMASYPTSVIVVPTVNIIQTDFPGNGLNGRAPLSPEFLLECWRAGMRLDTMRYAGSAPSSWRIDAFWMKA
jgi:hypothetical protein